MGIFEDIFDFNNDGELDFAEQTAAYGAYMQMVDSSKQDEIESAGIDMSDFEFMDDDEREVALEEAGLDPTDFDF